jgi:AcrR family transcriptional regulator
MARAGLTQARVVEAAATLIDAHGLGPLGLATLARELGVKTPSLYNHIASLDALHRELSLLALRELAAELTASAVGRSREAALRALAAAYRSYAKQHPGRYAFSVRAPQGDDVEHHAAAGAFLDVVTAALSGYNLTDDDAIDAVRALRAALHGWAGLEAARGFGMPRDINESFDRMVDSFDVILSSWSRPLPGSPSAAESLSAKYAATTPLERQQQ